jgi:hypothetical protein
MFKFMFGLILAMAAVGADDGASLSSIVFFGFFGCAIMYAGVKDMEKTYE